MEVILQAKGTDAKSRLQLTTTRKGVIWFDQVSLMPTDTYKVHITDIKFTVITFHLNDGLLYELANVEVSGVLVFSCFYRPSKNLM